MSGIPIYKAEPLSEPFYKVFSGVYNDFLDRARTDYKFELDPINCEEFIECTQKGLLECIILLEDNIPTGFLTYTTLISEALELNLIHCLGNSDLAHKRRVLLEKFLELNQKITIEKVVTYPMLGPQSDFSQEIKNYGFKIVNQSVVRFYPNSPSCLQVLKNLEMPVLPHGYEIVDWDNKYINAAVKIIHESFSTSSDRHFDPRFLTSNGCFDILGKIIKNVYGKFLPTCTKIMVYDEKPVGICFANLTSDIIANIPLIGIVKHHRHKGLSEYLLKAVVSAILDKHIEGSLHINEINASTDADNFSAVKMYRKIGFREDYRYPQAYLKLF